MVHIVHGRSLFPYYDEEKVKHDILNITSEFICRTIFVQTSGSHYNTEDAIFFTKIWIKSYMQ
jgi:hypothetical protein